MDKYATRNELAALAGYTYRRLHEIDKGLGESEKLFVKGDGAGDKCDVALFVQRWVGYKVRDARDVEEMSLDAARTSHEMIKMRKTELEVQEMEGALVRIEDVQRLWADIANTVMQNLLRIPAALSPRLVMQSSTDVIAQAIDAEVRSALNKIADGHFVASDDSEAEGQTEEQDEE